MSIFIDGNDQFTNASVVVCGSGTIDDPYINEGWDIDAPSSNGIEIRNSDVHFIVMDCYIHDGSYGYHGLGVHFS